MPQRKVLMVSPYAKPYQLRGRGRKPGPKKGSKRGGLAPAAVFSAAKTLQPFTNAKKFSDAIGFDKFLRKQGKVGRVASDIGRTVGKIGRAFGFGNPGLILVKNSVKRPVGRPRKRR